MEGFIALSLLFAKLQHLNLSWWHYYEPAKAGPALRDWRPSTSQLFWRPANLWCDLSGAKCNVLQVIPAQQDTEWMSEGAECSSHPRNQSPLTPACHGLCFGGHQHMAPHQWFSWVLNLGMAGPGAQRVGPQHQGHEITMENGKVFSLQLYWSLRRGWKAQEKWVFCPPVGHSPIFYNIFSLYVFQGKKVILANQY